ncbi:MAG TPA: NAD(P)-dependent oxidoreductase [Chthoniobacteraceae bacterium]|jgi:3-hydroxyisobutyrate dehydrogenase
MNSSTPRIAFLGLGIMGSGMAARLLGAGFPVTVYNRNSAKAEPLIAAGAVLAASPREAAADAEVIVSMVADDSAARAMWLEENGALSRANAGAICIESSTITLTCVRELGAAAKARGCEFLDAPVTGSRLQAASGELNFLVGGPAEAIERVRPVFAAMGKNVIPLGPAGSGALLKLINNFLCGVQVASLAEAMTMIERGGLDRAQALEVLTTGAPGSPLLKTLSARMTAPDFTPNFLLRLMAKDLGYAAQEASAQSLELTTAAAALKLFENAVAAGHGEKDMAAVIEPLRNR